MAFTQDLHAIQAAYDKAHPQLAHLREEWRITLAQAAAASEIDPEEWEDLALATTTALAPTDENVDFLLEATRLAPGIVTLGLDPIWLGKMDRRAQAFLDAQRFNELNKETLADMAARAAG